MANGIQKSKDSEELLKQLLVIPPDLPKIEKYIYEHHLNPDVISRAGFDFVEECLIEREVYEEWEEFSLHQFNEPSLDLTRSSAYMPQIIEMLLNHGLDPNAYCADGDTPYNIMVDIKFIVNEYAAADTLALLLEHGGNPRIVVEDEEFNRALDFDVCFDSINQNDRTAYDSMVHCWFVILGYSDNIINGQEAVTVYPVETFESDLKDFKISDLKQHRNYYFGLSNVPGRGDGWSLHIFDKRTRWEVARL